MEEQQLIAKLETQLGAFHGRNVEKSRYYNGSKRPTNVGFSTPPKMRSKAPRIGWAGVVVDALEERIQFLGWDDPSDTLGLDSVYRANRLDVESGLAHLDALIYGVGFVAVGTGAEGEPSPLVTIKSTMDTTGLWDGRTRRLAAALTVDPHIEGIPDTATLYLPDETVRMERASGTWVAFDRERHNLHRVPVVMLPNRTSASMRLGHSEISKPVQDLVDEASRVLLSMAVNREFFSGPQRLVLGAAPDDINGWKALTGGIWSIEADEDGKLPEVKQWEQISPGPHIEQLKALATQLAATAGIPDAYLGVAPSANPASADAIRAAEVRLIKKAERRCMMLGMGWQDVAELCCLIRFGGIPEELGKVSCKWADAGTPTRAAVADETSKYVAAGVLPATSRVVLERIGLTPAQQDAVIEERKAQPSMADVLASTVARQAQPVGV